MRMIRIVLAACGTAAAVWSQTGGDALRSTVELREREWSQANAVLFEAARKLNPCSPRIASLLTEVRAGALALAEANARYYTSFAAAARAESAQDRKFASEADAAAGVMKTAVDAIGADRAAVDAMRKQLPAEAPSELTAALGRLEVANRGGAAVGAVAAGDSESTRQLRSSVDAKEALIRQVEALTAAEAKRWAAYYDGIETGIGQQCVLWQPGTPKPARQKGR